MKRVLALLLCLTCLLGVLAACNDTPEVPAETTPVADTPDTTTTPNDDAGDPPSGDTPSGDTPSGDTPSGDTPGNTPSEPEAPKPTVPLLQYTIVYPKKASDSLKATAKRLQDSINAHTGDYKVALITDSDVPKTGYEILIGKTGRGASQEYYAGGVRSEYAILNGGKTIVLAGFTDGLTDKAVAYFEQTYLSNATDGKIVEVADHTVTVEKTFELSGANASEMKVVYSEGMEAAATKVVNAIKAATGITLSKKAASNYTYKADTPEILVGEFGVKETQTYENSLWTTGYVLANRGNKIIISASNAAQYELAATALKELFASNTLTGASGVYLFGDDVRRVMGEDVLSHTIGVSQKPTHVYPAGDGAYVAIFEGVNDSDRARVKFFREYAAALEAAGFTKYTATNFDGNKSTTVNKFATYVNDKVVVDLAFHTIGHLGCETLFGEPWWEYFSGGIMLVSVTPKSAGFTLPLQQAPAYTPLDPTQYPTILTQVGFGDFYDGGSNCYILRLADGTFIIHDSSNGSFEGRTPGDEIYKILKKQAPDPNNVVVSAWMTSHPHGDHIDGLLAYAKKYATDPTITIKQFVHNFADDSIAAKGRGSEDSNQQNVRSAIKKFKGAEVVKPYAGNVLYYANVKFNVLYTHIDHLPVNKGTRYDGNCSTMVLQMVTDNGIKVIFGGDHSSDDHQVTVGAHAYPFTYGALRKWYGTFIESDVMTYFHHGLGGGTDRETNSTIKPKIVLWPNTLNSIQKTLEAGTDLLNSWHANYVTAGKTFPEGILHETPNVNGVYGYFIADDNIDILNLSVKNAQGLPPITIYDTFEEYYNS